MISIIIRTKNEERWIESCLRKIQAQSYQDFEIILVDNKSSDKTVERAKTVMPQIKIVEIENYLPGFALNEGIRAVLDECKFLVCLSSHCVPKNRNWLEVLHTNFEDNSNLAGVYGRQIPMHFTNSHDKRDLIVTFGLDKRVQKKDPFFHNANSMIPKKIWDRFPFNERTTNIEDRLWAKEVLDAGYHLIYEPDAPVFHHHGIYQSRNEERLRNVIRIIGEDPEHSLASSENPFHQENLMIVVMIPVREEPDLDIEVQKRLLKLTIQHAKKSSSVNRVIVSTGSEILGEFAIKCGAEIPFQRPSELSRTDTKVLDVLQYTLEKFESGGTFFDYIVTLEITHPFRPENIVQQCVEYALKTGLESVMAGMAEYRPGWWLEDDEYQRIDNFIKHRNDREPIHIGLPAICSVVTPSLLRKGHRIGEKVGIVEVDNPLAQIEIRSNKDFESIGVLQDLKLESRTE